MALRRRTRDLSDDHGVFLERVGARARRPLDGRGLAYRTVPL